MNEGEKNEQVAKALGGDVDALQRLIVHYHAILRGVVATAIGGALRHRIDPDDVLQQAYISAFTSFADMRFGSAGHFYKWLETIALNHLKDVQRSLRRQKRDVGREVSCRVLPNASAPDLMQRLAAGDTTPSRHLAREEATAAVMTCLARLGHDQREVVRLRIIQDVPVAEIAQRLGKSEVAVYALCRRGLKSLHELMVPLTQYLTNL